MVVLKRTESFWYSVNDLTGYVASSSSFMIVVWTQRGCLASGAGASVALETPSHFVLAGDCCTNFPAQ